VNSLILRIAVAYLLPLLAAFSLFLLLRGHDRPGGGFSAGLIAASAVAFYTIAFSGDERRRGLRPLSKILTGLGLLMLVMAALWGPACGEPLLSAQWTTFSLPLLGSTHVGTPLLFDLGVYLTVTGALSTIIVALDEA
jgi:multicomponent Na+:H+ antiporter subunit B